MIVRFLVVAVLTYFVSRFAAGDGLVPGDVWLAQWMQEVSFPRLETAVDAINRAGQGIVQIPAALVLVLILFLFRLRAEALLLLLASLARLLNTPIKFFLNSPRPTIDLISVREEATGFGFPSGHAMGAVLFYGALMIILPAVIRPRWLAGFLQLLALLMILAAGFSRIHTGAHWPSDVLGGYLWGLLFLLPLGWLYHQYRWTINLRRWGGQA